MVIVHQVWAVLFINVVLDPLRLRYLFLNAIGFENGLSDIPAQHCVHSEENSNCMRTHDVSDFQSVELSLNEKLSRKGKDIDRS